MNRPDEAAALAVRQLSGAPPEQLTAMRRGENDVYRAVLADGRTVVVRVHRVGYHDLGSLRSELTWIRALRDAGVRAARPCGDVIHASDRLVTIFEWIDGVPFADREPTPEMFSALGRTMAELHRHARSWTPPSGFRRPRWDAEALVGPAPRWGRFEDAAGWPSTTLRELTQAREEVRRQLAEIGEDPSIFHLIHADLTPTNVLIGAGATSIIDFDDCGPGWLPYDAAVSLWEYEDHPDFRAFTAALLRGYEQQNGGPLPGAKHLPVFLMARRLNLLGWLATRGESDHARRTRERRLGSTPAAVQRFLDWALVASR